jgi:hypothetical protein
MDKMVIEMTRVATDGFEIHTMAVPPGADPAKKFSEIIDATREIGWDKIRHSKYGLPTVEFFVHQRGWYEELTLVLKMEWE